VASSVFGALKSLFPQNVLP
jgi:hypothetical protein